MLPGHFHACGPKDNRGIIVEKLFVRSRKCLIGCARAVRIVRACRLYGQGLDYFRTHDSARPFALKVRMTVKIYKSSTARTRLVYSRIKSDRRRAQQAVNDSRELMPDKTELAVSCVVLVAVDVTKRSVAEATRPNDLAVYPQIGQRGKPSN